jgi:hypothetical protein
MLGSINMRPLWVSIKVEGGSGIFFKNQKSI